MTTATDNKLTEIAARIREMREICDFSVEEMAMKTDTTTSQYRIYEEGQQDLPFSFIHKCALAFGLDISNLLEGSTAKLRGYTVTRGGEGQTTVDEDGIKIVHLAPRFRNKIAEPYWVRYEYKQEEQDRPIHLTTHKGQEFDYVISGHLKVQVGEKTEILGISVPSLTIPIKPGRNLAVIIEVAAMNKINNDQNIEDGGKIHRED